MNNISIKGVTTALLFGLGAVIIVLSIFSVVKLQDSAEEAQIASLTRVIQVGVQESYKKLTSLTADLANYTKQTANFNNAVNDLFSKNDDSSRISIEQLLNEQFHQRYVTSGVVKLAALRVYDLNLNLLAATSEGNALLPRDMNGLLKEQASVRSGADRLKEITVTWTNNNNAFYSALYPLGGLLVKGYLEVVLEPEYNLRDVKDILQLPLTIRTINGKQLFQSDNWNELQNEHSLPIKYAVPDASGKPALYLEALENTEEMHKQMSNTQTTVLGLFATVLVLSFVVAISILNKHLFVPANQLVRNIDECADGNLSIQIKSSGLKEIHQLNQALSKLVEKLREQVVVIGEDSDKLALASQTLSSITAKTTETIVKQRNETDQVATAINEMSASAAEVTKNAVGASESAKQAQEEARKGQAIVTRTIDSISEVANEVSRAAEVIQNLQSESHNIGAVLDVIRGIADQTNLLALNAAIEAARAGEQGRGFAVVADEVRTLASRTQVSTQEIHNMIEKLQNGADNAVIVMSESKLKTEASVHQAALAGQSLQTITSAVTDISNMNMEIASAAKEQSSVADVINRNIFNITDLADKTSEGANKLSANSTQLTDMASHLKGLVRHFKIS